MQDSVTSISSGLLSTRLQELMSKKNYNITKLAKATGTGVATIQRILSDINCNPTYSTLKGIADVFGISIGDLLGETETQFKLQHKVRLIPWADISTYLESDSFDEFCEGYEYVSAAVTVSNQSFALKLPASQMFPVFHEHSTLIFDPLKKPYDRSYILVKLHDHPNPVLKQLIKDEPFNYIKSISPLLSEAITELAEADKILATLVQSMIDH